MKRVAIIGAGPSGLASIKECKANGLEPICFESSSTIGGLWKYNTKQGIYQSTVMNTSKEMIQFSDFPIPKEFPQFLPHYMVQDYLEMYCDTFQLRDHIKFNRKIISVREELVDGNATGRWEVVYKSKERVRQGTITPNSRPNSPTIDVKQYPDDFYRGASIDSGNEISQEELTLKHKGSLEFRFNRTSEDGPYQENSSPIPGLKKSVLKRDIFDFVLVCTGHHWKPRMPEFRGMDKFNGTMIHSYQYKVPYPYKDDRVLVVGVGNSGMDISSELATHAATVILSSRSGTWIAPRTTLFGLPTDQLSTRASNSIPTSLMNFALESLVTLHHGDLSRLNLKPKHHFLEATPVIGGQIFPHIDTGKIRVKPNVKQFLAGSVEFEDGSIEEIDSVVFCTGYIVENPFLDNQIIGKEDPDSNRTKLYKQIFPTNCSNLAFIGLVQPNGSILPVSEMQARWACQVFAGTSVLPPLKTMRDVADLDWVEHLKRYVPRERMAIAVDAVQYMDMIATELKCKPDLWSLWKSDIRLAAMCTFGPCISSQYRLTGTGSWEGARQAIEEACSHLDLTSYIPKI